MIGKCSTVAFQSFLITSSIYFGVSTFFHLFGTSHKFMRCPIRFDHLTSISFPMPYSHPVRLVLVLEPCRWGATFVFVCFVLQCSLASGSDWPMGGQSMSLLLCFAPRRQHWEMPQPVPVGFQVVPSSTPFCNCPVVPLWIATSLRIAPSAHEVELPSLCFSCPSSPASGWQGCISESMLSSRSVEEASQPAPMIKCYLCPFEFGALVRSVMAGIFKKIVRTSDKFIETSLSGAVHTGRHHPFPVLLNNFLSASLRARWLGLSLWSPLPFQFNMGTVSVVDPSLFAKVAVLWHSMSFRWSSCITCACFIPHAFHDMAVVSSLPPTTPSVFHLHVQLFNSRRCATLP